MHRTAMRASGKETTQVPGDDRLAEVFDQSPQPARSEFRRHSRLLRASSHIVSHISRNRKGADAF
jgi:hypothetical protein